MTEQTTGDRDELSRTLRQLRHTADLSDVEAGRLAGFWQAKVSRIEEASEHIATFTPTVVPGLLQTEPYARAIFSSADLTPSEIDKAVTARITRQQLLHDPGHRFTLITTAGALAWRAGTPEQMAAQVDHIAESTRLPNAKVGVIPWGTQARVFPLHGWDLYDRRAVIVGTANATAVLTESADVAVYADIFAQMEGMAVYDNQARSVLTRIADEYRELGATS